ncbi:uncharacterized protein LOC142231451 [Haematobia irritans]|uniref:uncharacterized protein LOC142231451 n=1 Tax=Haematobia irritans TaxID=7368 RepID=UPI003F50A08A
MNFVTKHHVFGETRCWIYSVEWQKRGLPHAHILIWLTQKLTPDTIDNIISAEIPNPNEDPDLHAVVTKNMIHGPCGAINPNSPCMVEGKCTKRYPRQLLKETISGVDGYPLYRRRSMDDNGQSVTLKVQNRDVDVDNRWIVPYCPLLSKTFKAHINVEYCNSVKSIKYICKYVTKGSDMAVFSVQNPKDEISQYQMARYISSNEAVWRIFGFPIHERYPAVVHLPVHLENGNRVYFTGANAQALAEAGGRTKLTAFFELCQYDIFAATLLYAQIPTYFVWNNGTKTFQRRKQGKRVYGYSHLFSSDALGRLYTVHPQNSKCFYLRMLLINVPGPTSFDNLRTVNNEVCVIYREACQKLNLLESDLQWETTLNEASTSQNPSQIRALFAVILITCFPTNPNELWNKFKSYMTEDILHRERMIRNDTTIEISQDMFNQALMLLQDKCLQICNKSLRQLGMESPNDVSQDEDFRREKNFSPSVLQSFLQCNLPRMQPQQNVVFNTIISAVKSNQGGFYFIDAPGGTGKTFLISFILAKVRSEGNIALAIASSGIAATLLDGGRTAHSALKLPLNIQFKETHTCNIRKDSSMGKVLQTCKIIVWDECTMAHKNSLEALDRTFKDFRSNGKFFGGALLLLAGDFRQTLPVVPRSTPADELNACLKSSFLWRHVKSLQLKTNMRVQLQNDASATQFSKSLFNLGNGQIPAEPSTNYWLQERALLAAKNLDVNITNNNILQRISGCVTTYKSIDTIIREEDIVNYPVEFLNSLDLPGFPPHILQLKVGVPIILLRNIDPPRFCNGTRLAVKKLHNNLIEGTIITGN